MAPLLRRRSFLATMTAAAAAAAASPALARSPISAEAGLWRGLALQDASGRIVQVGSEAPTTLLMMWAHWCPTCVSQLPALTALAQSMGPKLQVLLVSHPEYWAQDRATAQQRRIPLRLVTAAPGNDPAVVRAALTPDGSYPVPRSLAFRAGSPDVAWKSSKPIDWASADAAATLRNLVA